MELKSCAFSDFLDIDYWFKKGILETKDSELLLIGFRGRVGNAPKISQNFELMSSIVLAGLEAWKPSALLLDFQELEYQWGDGMARVLQIPEEWFGLQRPAQELLSNLFSVEKPPPKHFPVAILASEKNLLGLRSLLEEQEKSYTPPLFKTSEEAILYLNQSVS